MMIKSPCNLCSNSLGQKRQHTNKTLGYWSRSLWCGLQPRFIPFSWLFQQQMKPLKPLSRQTRQLTGQRTISLSQQQLRALPWTFQMTFIAAADFLNSFYFDGLEQNNNATLPSEKTGIQTLDLCLFWFWLEYKRLQKGNNSEHVCVFTPHGGLTSFWATGAFYSFQKWYCVEQVLYCIPISAFKWVGPFHAFENWFSVEVDTVDVLMEFHFLSDFLDIAPSRFPPTSLKVSFLSWLAHFIYLRPYK